MPLSSAQAPLYNAIVQAFNSALEAGKVDGASSTSINQTLARGLAAAIVDYVTQATVITTVAPGQVVLTAGSPTAHVGATLAPGSGTGQLI